jgi:hypothetical protein
MRVYLLFANIGRRLWWGLSPNFSLKLFGVGLRSRFSFEFFSCGAGPFFQRPRGRGVLVVYTMPLSSLLPHVRVHGKYFRFGHPPGPSSNISGVKQLTWGGQARCCSVTRGLAAFGRTKAESSVLRATMTVAMLNSQAVRNMRLTGTEYLAWKYRYLNGGGAY